MITFSRIGYMGRLGNQMFQLAATIGIASERGFDAGIPIENCTRKIGNGPIDVNTGLAMNVKCDLLDCFNIPSKYLISEKDMKIRQVYCEGDFKFNTQVLSLEQNTDLYGYFQTEKYFKSIETEIREIFSFRSEIIAEGNKYCTIENGVSIHIRRGDYLTSSDYHPVQSLSYYNDAISKFNENSNFYIFSDDPEWCKLNFNVKNSKVIESGNPYIDMYLMSLCDGHIIANSSFSWWGAWLSKKSDKTVVAPSKWFGKYLPKDTSDIYCENWIKI